MFRCTPTMRYFLVGILFCWVQTAFSQQAADRQRWVPCKAVQPFADSLPIVPSSVQLLQLTPKATQGFAPKVVWSADSLYLQTENPAFFTLTDSVLIGYRTFSEGLFGITQRYDLAQYQAGKLRDFWQDLPTSDHVAETTTAPDQTLGSGQSFSPKLQKNGYLSRGLMMGNRQDANLQSAMQLDLEGQLTPYLSVEARFTDRNIPFQPEGNALQLQDPDRVSVALQHHNGRLEAGDISLRNDSLAFLNFSRQVQGAKLSLYHTDSANKRHQSSSLSASVVRGKFHRLTLQPQEGVLGPYRLSGPAGQRFIMVLASSERIYLNGQLLQRGIAQDYTIDYNQAEITFTPQVTLTAFSRLIVEFEYVNQQFQRNLLHATHRQHFGRWQVGGELYRERDLPERLLTGNLSEAGLQALQQMGDQVGGLLPPQADTVTAFDPAQTLYTSADTTVAGSQYSFYKRASAHDSPLLRLQFVEVGQGKGHYVRENSTRNGQWYRWVAPINGLPQGNYSPGQQLPTPNALLIAGGDVRYRAPSGFFVGSGMTLSQHDRNLLSAAQDADNGGKAAFAEMGFQKPTARGKGTEKPRVQAKLRYEWVDSLFTPAERFRAVEFGRDWGHTDTLRANEHLLRGQLAISKQEHYHWQYAGSLRKKGTGLGWQQAIQGRMQWRRWSWEGGASLLQNQQGEQQSSWRRAHSQLQFNGSHWQPGYRYRSEQHLLRHLPSDTLSASQDFYHQHTVFIQNGDSLQGKWELSYQFREDSRPQREELGLFARSHQWGVGFRKSTPKANWQLKTQYRRTTGEVLAQRGLPQSLNGQLAWQQQAMGGALKTNLLYQTITAREPLRDFVFLPVPGGQGTHTWQDLNGDGEQTIDEFFPAYNPDERNYARFFLPTDTFIPAFQNLLQYRLDWRPPLKWQQQKGLLKWFGKFSAQAQGRFRHKTLNGGIATRLLPLLESESDSLLAADRQWSSNITYNRGGPWQLTVGYRSLGNRQLLGGGTETRLRQGWEAAFRWHIGKAFTYELNGETGARQQHSELAAGRNFRIAYQKLAPQLTYQPAPAWQLRGQYQWQYSQPEGGGAETLPALQHEISLNLRGNLTKRGNLNGTLAWTSVNFAGDMQAPYVYELLEGLRPGQNWRLSCTWAQPIGKALQLQLTYQGRKPPGSRLIHLGRCQISAAF